MRRTCLLFASAVLILAGCSAEPLPPEPANTSSPQPAAASSRGLMAEREGHTTQLIEEMHNDQPPETPPEKLFQLVQYDGPLGKMNAYLSVAAPAQKRPAIIWLSGGFSNSISPLAWDEPPTENDQSARQYRAAGIVTMYPALRGGSGNPGAIEVMYGEVDDVIAAGKWLAQQPGIDPQRIYLGGHSTGGTLALLVAEATDQFRAVFSFGPIENPYYYGPNYMVFYDFDDHQEHRLRSPVHWLNDITSRTFVLEGSNGNADSVVSLKSKSSNPQLSFHLVPGGDHFDILGPVNALIAKKIKTDTGEEVSIDISRAELSKAIP